MTNQNKKNVLLIPEEFRHPLFFKGDLIFDYTKLPVDAESLKKQLFIYDILFNKNMLSAYFPWKDEKKLVNSIFDDWQKASRDVAELFRKRDRKSARKPMIEYTGLFIEALYWCNNYPVYSLINWKEKAEQLKIKPVNALERTAFLIEQPDHYHSYIQLNELFAELSKKYQKAVLLKK